MQCRGSLGTNFVLACIASDRYADTGARSVPYVT